MSAQSLIFQYCPKGCCSITTKPYKHIHTSYDFRHKFNNIKAGIFFYDPISKRVLLVQSRGMKWGPPKGSMEDIDSLSIENCAIREVKEESGIDVDISQLTSENKYRIDRATYYYIEYAPDASSLDIPGGHDNDASGITWIDVDCLCDMYDRRIIDLNSHCKKLLRKILKINL